jgi:hypothetical protein
MGSIAEAVPLVLAGSQPNGQPVSSRATVQLATTEPLVGAVNTLGAFKGNHFLYYQPPGRPEQEWQIEVDSSGIGDGKLHAGDAVAFLLARDPDRKMAQDGKETTYLSLDPTTRGFWQLELI